MKDNATLSSTERQHERELEQHAREDKSRSRGFRPTAARMVQRVKGMKRAAGQSRSGKQPSIRTTHPARPMHAPPPARESTRRAFVRARWVGSRKLGQWAAHAKYLERDGAQAEGQRGVGFSQLDDAVSMAGEANRWQKEGDQRVYKLVLSPEDGTRLDLVAYTRAIMLDVEKQVGKPLEWTAIDHHNTANPHVHILLRGKGIELPDELVRAGLRAIAEDHAVRALGYKSEKEKRAELDKDIPARRFTQLDRMIQKKGQQMADGSLVVTENGLSRITESKKRNQTEIELRAKRIARMQKLEELGVCEKIGVMTWRLDAGWDTALKQLEVLRTRSTMLIQHRELMTDPRALPVVTKLKSGESLIGRSLGGGIDDTTDKPYFLVEGMDGRAHFISRSDTADAIKPGRLIALEGYTSSSGNPSVKVIEYDLAIPSSGFTKVMTGSAAVAKAANDELDRREKSGKPVPEIVSPSVGFAAQMQRAIIEQAGLRALQKSKDRKPGGQESGITTERD